MGTLAEYQTTVENQHDRLLGALGGGVASAYTIAICRIAHERMDAELTKSPQEVIAKWDFRAKQENMPHAGPTLWQMDWQKRADKELRPLEPTETQFQQKNNEYIAAITRQLKDLNVKTHSTGHCDINYFIEEHPYVQSVKEAFIRELSVWVGRQRFEPKFYQQSALMGMAAFLEQRQDIVIAIRASQNLGAGRVTATPIEVPIWQELLAFGTSFIPYVGSGIALAEAWEGRDIFCRKLDTVERVLIVALIAIPPLMKIARGGKAIYTAERMATLYGRDAAKWNRAIMMGERASAHPTVRKAILNAADRVRAKQALDAQTVKDVEKAIAILTGRAPAPTVPALTEAQRKILEALKKLGANKAALSELDQLALNRVVEAARTKAGPDIALGKGQLLEEFKEARTVKLLREQFGKQALGIEGGGTAEYFPGHMLTDHARQKITDGIVGTRITKAQIKPQWYGGRSQQEIENIRGVIQPFAIDEAKAGRASAKGLGYKYKVTEADIVALKAVALRRFQKLKDRAAKEGKPFAKTLEEVEKEVAGEYKLGEIGGQARSTIERLDMNEDGSLPSLFLGDEEYLVYIPGVSKVKIFGVIPKNVPGKALTKKLRAEGINFEVLGVNVTAEELEELTVKALGVTE